MAEDPKPTPQDRVNKLISDLFPSTIDAPTNLPQLTVTSSQAVSPARQSMFLDAVELGWSETKARKMVQVSQGVVDSWKMDQVFIKRLKEAERSGTDYLKDLAFLRAHDSDTVLMRLLESRDDAFKRTGSGGKGDVNVIINNLYPEEPLDNPQIIIEGRTDERRNES